MHNSQFSPLPAARGGPLWAQQRLMFKALAKLEHPINEKIKHHLWLNSPKNKLESPLWEVSGISWHLFYDGVTFKLYLAYGYHGWRSQRVQLALAQFQPAFPKSSPLLYPEITFKIFNTGTGWAVTNQNGLWPWGTSIPVSLSWRPVPWTPKQPQEGERRSWLFKFCCGYESICIELYQHPAPILPCCPRTF